MKTLFSKQLRLFHQGIAFIENQGLFGYLYYGFIGYLYASIVANTTIMIMEHKLTFGQLSLFLFISLIVFLFYSARLVYPCEHQFNNDVCLRCGVRHK